MYYINVVVVLKKVSPRSGRPWSVRRSTHEVSVRELSIRGVGEGEVGVREVGVGLSVYSYSVYCLSPKIELSEKIYKNVVFDYGSWGWQNRKLP